jgi:hypothetical protein
MVVSSLCNSEHAYVYSLLQLSHQARGPEFLLRAANCQSYIFVRKGGL